MNRKERGWGGGAVGEEEQMGLSSKSKRRKWQEEGCSDFCLTVCLKVPLNTICLQTVPLQWGQNFSAPAENWNSQNATAEAVPLSSLTAELCHCEPGNQNNCNIQTLLHHHTNLDLTCIFTFAPLFMKLVTKPHLLKVSVLFYLTLNKRGSSNPKEKTPNKKNPRTLHSQSLDTVCIY